MPVMSYPLIQKALKPLPFGRAVLRHGFFIFPQTYIDTISHSVLYNFKKGENYPDTGVYPYSGDPYFNFF